MRDSRGGVSHSETRFHPRNSRTTRIDGYAGRTDTLHRNGRGDAGAIVVGEADAGAVDRDVVGATDHAGAGKVGRHLMRAEGIECSSAGARQSAGKQGVAGDTSRVSAGP